MDDIEDYDDEIQQDIKKIEKFIKFADSKQQGTNRRSNDTDKSNYLHQIKRLIKKIN